jgi:hypothetical protein
VFPGVAADLIAKLIADLVVIWQVHYINARTDAIDTFFVIDRQKLDAAVTIRPTRVALPQANPDVIAGYIVVIEIDGVSPSHVPRTEAATQFLATID